MEYEDYMLILDGFKVKMNLESANLRRQTYLIMDTIARAAGAKGGININEFNRAWPLDDEIQQDVSEMLEDRKKINKEHAIKMSNDINLIEAIKKLKGGGRDQNSHRGGRKSGNK